MNVFFWRRRPQITGEGFRARLNELAGELERQLGDLADDPQRELLRKELDLVAATYRNDANSLRQHLP